MTANNGFSVEVRDRPGGKRWVFVVSSERGSPIAFADWYTMIRAIVDCEIVKYGKGTPETYRADWEWLSKMPSGFLADCFDIDATYEELRIKYGLPR